MERDRVEGGKKLFRKRRASGLWTGELSGKGELLIRRLKQQGTGRGERGKRNVDPC